MERVRVFVVVFVCLMAWGINVLPAEANIIPITSIETIFSFDFTSLQPSPPYTNIKFMATFDASDPITVGVDTMLVMVYGGLNGTELVQVRDDTSPGFYFDHCFNKEGTEYLPHYTANPIFDPMLDGTFSFGLQMISGSANLISFTACGVINGVEGPCMTYPTPEPAMLSLLALGGVGLLRRKK